MARNKKCAKCGKMIPIDCNEIVCCDCVAKSKKSKIIKDTIKKII